MELLFVSPCDLLAEGLGQFIVCFLCLAWVGNEVSSNSVNDFKEAGSVVAMFFRVEGKVTTMSSGVALMADVVHKLLDMLRDALLNSLFYHFVNCPLESKVLKELLNTEAQEDSGSTRGLFKYVGGFEIDVAHGLR